MAKEIKDKIIVITGGAEGIGFQITKHLLEKQAKVAIILDVNKEKGEAAARKLNEEFGDNRAVFIKCDVTKDLEEVSEKLIATYKTIDVLVNNAGVINDYDVKLSVNVNTTAVIEWSLKFWNHMRTDKGGKGGTIINISSIYGYRIIPFNPVYHGTKFAVLGFTRSLGHEYNYLASGVRAVAICPGLTYTTMTKTVKGWEPELLPKEHVENVVKATIWQEAEFLGKGAVDVFEKAESGSAWLIEGGKSAEEIKFTH